MVSNSRRRSGSSGGSSRRKRVVIPATDAGRSHARRSSGPREQTAVRAPRKGVSAKAPRSGQGKRLAASKRAQRERRLLVARLRAVAWTLAIAAVVAAAVGGLCALASGPVFRIEEVTVSGSRHHSETDVVTMARIAEGATLIDVRASDFRKRLLLDPWIREVKVRRRFPSTLAIEVSEHVPAAIVDVGGADLWVASADGRWLGLRSAAETGVIPIRDIEAVTPVAGTRIRSESLLNAVRVAAGLSDELRSVTRMISAPSVEKTALITHDEIQIYIGDVESLEEKDRVARAILEKEKGKLVYINVRVASSPTWRGLD